MAHTMSSRDRVLSAFEHVEPDRVPAWCGSSPEFWEKAKRTLDQDDEGLRVLFGDDFRRVMARYAGPELPRSPDTVSTSVFGVERRGMGYGQPVSHPLDDATLKQVHDYAWPDPAWMDYSHIRAETEGWGGSYAILGGDWSPFWHDAIDLFGTEYLFLQMFDRPELVDALFTHLVDYYAAVSERIFQDVADALDIFFIGNDFGTRMGPMIGPDQFERFVLPHLARLIDLGHAYGLKVMLHCCGGFAPLIPLMIEVGLDGVHAIQPACRGMDLQKLKDEFGERLVFNGAIDSHHVLIEGTPDLVREKTREVLDIMKPGGGYIAGASHDTILEETPVENVVAMFETIGEYGTYLRCEP